MALVRAMGAHRAAIGMQWAAARSLSTATQLNQQLKVDNLLIIGSGLMGSGIAQSSAMTGKFQSIVVQDVSRKQLDIARARLAESLLRVKKKNPQLDDQAVLNRITWSTKLEPASDKNLLVIEAVPEMLELKQKLFKDLNAAFKNNDSVILATNTSSLSCKDIGIHVENRKRFAGLHFFNPVVLMKLVEIIRVGADTDDATYNALVQYVKDIDKVGITCKDTAGFVVNRLLIPYMFSAIEMLERGDATAKDIDIGMKLGAGYPMGPFELLDYTGLDTAKFIGDKFRDEQGKPITGKSKILDKLVSDGKLGRKTGAGFYDYTKKK